MGFNLDFALSTIPTIVGAIGATLLATVLSCLGASALGFSFEMIRRGGGAAGLAVRFLIDFIRSRPVLAWLYFLYFVMPFYGIRLGAMTVGVMGLSLYYSGYLAEVFKAGIDAIPKGQQEAARSLVAQPPRHGRFRHRAANVAQRRRTVGQLCRFDPEGHTLSRDPGRTRNARPRLRYRV